MPPRGREGKHAGAARERSEPCEASPKVEGASSTSELGTTVDMGIGYLILNQDRFYLAHL